MSVKCILTNQLNDKLIDGAILSIAQGGTGANNATTAIRNLGGVACEVPMTFSINESGGLTVTY